jgi:predicted small metal-binding protein
MERQMDGPMNEVLRCDCGFEVRAVDAEGLLAEVRSHAWQNHQMALSRSEALDLTRNTPGLVGDEASRLQEGT